MSQNQREGLRLADVDARNNAELNNAIDATVQHMSIEYLRRQHAAKPHVVFNFNTLNSLELLATRTQQSQGCSVSMDWTGMDDKGELVVRTRPYNGCITSGAREVIDIFRGRHPLNADLAGLVDGHGVPQFWHLADLTDFDFVQALPHDSMDGCRDFMYVLWTSTNGDTFQVLTEFASCHAFIRLCEFGIVSCLGHGITSRGNLVNFNQAIPPVVISGSSTSYFGFYDVIHKDFLPVNPEAFNAGTDLSVNIMDLPMHRGEFFDPMFQRREVIYVHETNEIRTLNYVPDSQPSQQGVTKGGGNGRGAGAVDPSAAFRHPQGS